MPRRVGAKIAPPPRHFIRQWRAARDLSQEKLADMIGASTSIVSRIEAGKLGYTQAVAEAIAQALNTSVVSLLAVNPAVEGDADIHHMVDQMTRREREQAIRLLRALKSSAA